MSDQNSYSNHQDSNGAGHSRGDRGRYSSRQTSYPSQSDTRHWRRNATRATQSSSAEEADDFVMVDANPERYVRLRSRETEFTPGETAVQAHGEFRGESSDREDGFTLVNKNTDQVSETASIYGRSDDQTHQPHSQSTQSYPDYPDSTMHQTDTTTVLHSSDFGVSYEAQRSQFAKNHTRPTSGLEDDLYGRESDSGEIPSNNKPFVPSAESGPPMGSKRESYIQSLRRDGRWRRT
jgi:hypothetical protein